MKAINFKPYISFSLHVLGWCLLGFLLLFYIPLTWNVVLPKDFWTWQLMALGMMLVLFYVNYFLIVPNTIIKNKTGAFFVWLFVSIVIVQLVAHAYDLYTNMREQMSAILGAIISKKQLFDSFIFTITLLVLGISTSLAMLQNWQQSAQQHQQLEQEKTVAELAMLKSQINPHFFFNTLNNVYSLTYIDVEASRHALHTLSRMMRYLLYGTEKNETTLQKEVEFLKDYISLMQLRLNDKQKIKMCFPSEIKDYQIAPMLLLPFIENAFKHGIDAVKSSEINIHLQQKDTHIEFDVENNVFENTKAPLEESGIGLTNTKRRLELMYPERHKLKAGINNTGKYKVNLQLQLAPL